MNAYRPGEYVPQHDAIAEWDAAYVLGALSPVERRRFEQHLRECPLCTDSVAELAGMPGLLGKVAQADGVAVDDATPIEVPATLLPRLEAAARADRRRRWTATWGIAAAAAALGVLGALALPLIDQMADRRVNAELAHVADVPLTASVELTSTVGGTHIVMICNYPYGSEDVLGVEAERRYDLFVLDSAGEARRVSTWTPWAGTTIEVAATVENPIEDIAAVQVRDSETGRLLLAADIE